MLQQIDSKHLAALEDEISRIRASEKECWIKMSAAKLDCAALEAELQRVTAQRDALRDALRECVTDPGARAWENENTLHRRVRAINESARAALQACQD